MKRPNGFTLIEVAIGLTVAALVLLIARVTFAQVADTASRIASARKHLDHRANGRRWLSAAFRSLQAGQGRFDTFRGSASAVSFTARMLTPRGWNEAAPVALQMVGTELIAVVSGSDTVTLARNLAAFESQYLLTSGERSEWLRGWYSPSTAPVAIRLILWSTNPDPDLPAKSDTLLYLVGSRG